MMLMLQYPLLPALSVLCALLAAAAVARPRMWLTVCTALLVSAMLLAGLVCMLPYHELLLLLLPSLLACMGLLTKGGAV